MLQKCCRSVVARCVNQTNRAVTCVLNDALSSLQHIQSQPAKPIDGGSVCVKIGDHPRCKIRHTIVYRRQSLEHKPEMPTELYSRSKSEITRTGYRKKQQCQGRRHSRQWEYGVSFQANSCSVSSCTGSTRFASIGMLSTNLRPPKTPRMSAAIAKPMSPLRCSDGSKSDSFCV